MHTCLPARQIDCVLGQSALQRDVHLWRAQQPSMQLRAQHCRAAKLALASDAAARLTFFPDRAGQPEGE